jgi:Phage integrase family
VRTGKKTNPKPIQPGTVNWELDTLRSICSKAVEWGKLRESPVVRVKRLRADIKMGDVTLHTLRHTALSRMIAAGHGDYTVMEISGHSSTRMLARYTHPTEARKIGALNLSSVGRTWAEKHATTSDALSDEAAIAEFLKESGGRQEARTPDLRVANAALSQLS